MSRSAILRFKHPWRRLRCAAGRWLRRQRRRGASADVWGRVHVEAIRCIVAAEAVTQARLALGQGDPAGAAPAISRLAELRADHPDIPELRACEALLRGEAQRGEQVLQRARQLTPRGRLLMHLLQMQTARCDLAHLELSGWSRQSTCPPRARLLTAWLDWRRTSADAARARLQRRGRQEDLPDDPQDDRLQLLIAWTQRMPHSGRHYADQLMARLGMHAPTQRFCRSLELTESQDATISPDLVNALAEQLDAHQHLVPTLVAAQRVKPRPIRVQLLRRALRRIVDRVAEPLPIVEALAELAELAGDPGDAERWARRGLRQPPYSAKLALLLDRVHDTPTAASPVSMAGILRQVARAHPDWPDVRRALVLRLKRDGRAAQARRQMQLWIERDSTHPLIARTQQELAA